MFKSRLDRLCGRLAPGGIPGSPLQAMPALIRVLQYACMLYVLSCAMLNGDFTVMALLAWRAKRRIYGIMRRSVHMRQALCSLERRRERLAHATVAKASRREGRLRFVASRVLSVTFNPFIECAQLVDTLASGSPSHEFAAHEGVEAAEAYSLEHEGVLDVAGYAYKLGSSLRSRPGHALQNPDGEAHGDPPTGQGGRPSVSYAYLLRLVWFLLFTGDSHALYELLVYVNYMLRAGALPAG